MGKAHHGFTITVLISEIPQLSSDDFLVWIQGSISINAVHTILQVEEEVRLFPCSPPKIQFQTFGRPSIILKYCGFLSGILSLLLGWRQSGSKPSFVSTLSVDYFHTIEIQYFYLLSSTGILEGCNLMLAFLYTFPSSPIRR